jgi:hypothetical protein
LAFSNAVFSTRSDVYSFGVLLWEIYSDGATPYGDLTASELVAALCSGHRLKRPHITTPETVVGIIRICTSLELSARPPMSRLRHQLHALEARDGSDMQEGRADLGLTDDDSAEESVL